jgi:hypothetical protein
MTGDATSRGLLDVNRFVIPKKVLTYSIEFLRAVGQTGSEGFILWSGKFEAATTFRFTNALAPDQKAFSTPEGLLVTVAGDALFSINKVLYERGEILAAQVHTHPTSAYHSGTDDHYPMVTLLGALSIVIPDFARNAPKDIAAWAWYRLRAYGNWAPLGENTQVSVE